MWMSKGAYDIFTHVIKFLGANQQPKHITVGLLEAFDTFGHALAKDLIELLGKYDLKKIKIAYVKNEGSNLYTTIIALKFVVNCDVLSLTEIG